MSTSPCIPAPEKNHGGGPTTEAGKAASSQNAITYGLFAIRDFIRPEEQSIYDEFAQSLRAELAPAGMLELNLADEIRRAMWRLRRCGQIEESFSGPAEDPMQQEATAHLQSSVDRARSQAHRLLHRCTAELRKLQTERQYRNEYFDEGTDVSQLGLCDLRTVQKNIDKQQVSELRRPKRANNDSTKNDWIDGVRIAGDGGNDEAVEEILTPSSFCIGANTASPQAA
jgi:hypothetical protein